MDDDSLLPKQWQILSGSSLKIIAVVTMLIDYVASALLREGTPVVLTLLGHEKPVYELMRYVGRLSFPLFAFLIVEGFQHTRDRKKYGRNLFLLAQISELPWKLEHNGA